jgi:hypothetical protein
MSPDELAQKVFSDRRLEALLDDDLLTFLQPKPGSAGMPPTMVVATHTGTGLRLLSILIDDPRFDQWEMRMQIMREVGQRLGAQQQRVVALVFASEAWMKTLSVAEWQQGDRRPAGDYQDREEVLVVLAQTLDGRSRSAIARIERTAQGAIKRVAPWQRTPPSDQTRSALLQAAWQGYARAMLQPLN